MDSNTDFLIITKETKEEFEKIAKRLFFNHAIQNQDGLYRITEIEFYWNSPKHRDDSTYKRKHVEPKNGDWFFHYTGVDIALRNDQINGYGGILIRGIYSLTEDRPYNGPMVCSMKLFSGTNAFNELIPTKIISYKFLEMEMKESTRVGLGKNARMSGTDKLMYRFYINAK